MEILIFLILIAIAVGIPYLFIKRKRELKAKGVLKEFVGLHAEGIPFMNQGQMVNVYLYPDKITINDNYTIPLRDITNLNIGTEKEIAEKNRSVIGRAVVGGAVLGPLGAVVGGMSEVKNKQVTKEKCLLVIDYKGNEGPVSAKFSTRNHFMASGFAGEAVKLIRAQVQA